MNSRELKWFTSDGADKHQLVNSRLESGIARRFNVQTAGNARL